LFLRSAIYSASLLLRAMIPCKNRRPTHCQALGISGALAHTGSGETGYRKNVGNLTKADENPTAILLKRLCDLEP